MKRTFISIISVIVALSALIAVVMIPASAVSVPEPSAPLSDMVVTGANKGIYLRLNNIEGEAKDSKHDKWIDILYFKHGAEQTTQSDFPGESAESTFQPVVFKHLVDKATPKLQEACMKNTFIKTAKVEFCHSIAGKQETIYTIQLDGIRIVKTEVETEDLGDGKYQLVETVTLLVDKQTWTVLSIGLDNSIGGTTEAHYDQSKKV